MQQGCPERRPEAGGDQQTEEQAGPPASVEGTGEGPTGSKGDHEHPGVEDITRVGEREVPEVVVGRVPEVVRNQAGRKEAGMDPVRQDGCVGLLLAQDQMRVFERAQELDRRQPGGDQEGSRGDGGPAGHHVGDGPAAGAPRSQRSGGDRHGGPEPGCHPDVVGDLGVPRQGAEAQPQAREGDPPGPGVRRSLAQPPQGGEGPHQEEERGQEAGEQGVLGTMEELGGVSEEPAQDAVRAWAETVDALGSRRLEQ